MSLYDDASLIAYPSGYKESKIYAQKPVNGTGDLTFTRASSATRVNAEGLIEEASVIGSELVVNGDFATDTSWTKGTGWTISGGVANSDGTQTGFSNLNQVTTASVGSSYIVSYTISNYISGSVSAKIGASSSATTRSSNGFFSEVMVCGTNNQIYIIANSSFIGSIDNVSVKEVITSNVPRIDYSNGCGSLLLEPQRTNLVTYSEDFSQSYWGKLGLGVASAPSVTSNTSISPSGEQNASRVIFDLNGGTAASDRSIIRVSESTSSARVFSIYIKSFDGTDQQISLHSGGEGSPFTVTSEWTRYTFSISSGVSFIGFGLKGTNGVDVSDVLFYGAQLELGSYSTSLINTSGTTVTRLADTSSTTGISSLINSTEGVFYAEIATLTQDNTSVVELTLNDGSSSNRVAITFTTSNNTLRAIVRVGSANQFNSTNSLSNITEYSKIAIKYKANDFALWVNGIELDTDNIGISFSALTLNNLSFNNGSGSSDFYGNCQNLMVFPSALTDDELADITGAVHQTFNSLATFYGYTIL
tara:strand:+ start:6850 stop:8445 length:1596 start_codon:yes stop_codon:yes gene_type:complete